MLVYGKYQSYARGTLGIGCMRFKHGGIRMDTVRQIFAFKTFVQLYGLYDKHTLGIP